MKKNLIALFLALLMLSVSFAGVAEEAVKERVPGNYPERGIVLAMTEEDVKMGLACSFTVGATDEIPQLPIFSISYTDPVALEALFSQYSGMSEEELASEDVFMALFLGMFECTHGLYQIALFDTDFINEKKAGGGMLDDTTSIDDLTILGENGGYTYILIDIAESLTFEDAVIAERVNAAASRAKELIDTLSFQEIVFADGEFTKAPDAFPAFEVLDINGNTVTNDIFSGKDLTVINIWGTFCNPCIEEMPELAAWSAEMPDNVQIIGLVSDLSSADDLETLEMAKAICEATGADAYTHLIAEEDFAELLSGVVGVPTTLFVNGQGAPVGEPVVGANVNLCRKIANDYLGTL